MRVRRRRRSAHSSKRDQISSRSRLDMGGGNAGRGAELLFREHLVHFRSFQRDPPIDPVYTRNAFFGSDACAQAPYSPTGNNHGLLVYRCSRDCGCLHIFAWTHHA